MLNVLNPRSSLIPRWTWGGVLQDLPFLRGISNISIQGDSELNGTPLGWSIFGSQGLRRQLTWLQSLVSVSKQATMRTPIVTARKCLQGHYFQCHLCHFLALRNPPNANFLCG